MINQITTEIYIPPFLTNKINTYKPFNGNSWEIDGKEIRIFKRLLKEKLLEAQNNCCAYCGLPLDETGKTEIEHFAPKGGSTRPRHVEFTFEVNNLYLSCNLCNSPLKKGNTDTIINKSTDNYANCVFSIVHPRYDDPTQHYSWVTNSTSIIIRGQSSKGHASIKMFKLDSTAHTEARAKKELLRRYNLASPDQKALLDSILNYT